MTSLEQIPLSELNLYIRHHNSLIRAGCLNLGQLQRAIESNSLWNVRNLGEKSITEIQKKMEQYLLENDVQLNTPFVIDIDDEEPIGATGLSVKPQILDIRAIADLRLDLLSSYLQKDQIKLLSEAGIQTVGQLNGVLEIFLSFLSPDEQLLSKTINVIRQRLRKHLQAGSLSSGLAVGDMSLDEVLQYQPIDNQERLDYLLTLKHLVLFENLDQELGFVFSDLTERQEAYYLKYHLENTTLEALSEAEGITRERVRQIISDSRRKIESGLLRIRLDFVNSALAIAKGLRGELSRDVWELELKNHSLVQGEEAKKTIDRLFAILSDKNLTKEIFEIPENVSIILKKATDVPVYVVRALKEIPSKQFREVNRRVMFTGGVHKDSALERLGCKPEELKAILAHRGLIEIEPDWFSIREAHVGDSRQPLLQAGLRMWQFCGPLPFGSFVDGLQRYIARQYDSLAPEKVLIRYLDKLGFRVEEGMVTYEGKETVKLSGSEEIALRLLAEIGPVVSFQEMVTGFLENGYSAASAVVKIMGGSAVVERIGTGFYKKRGVIHSDEDLKRAMLRQEAVEREPSISITSDGKVRYQTTLNSWALGGSLSVGKMAQYLPDLSQGCPIFVGEKECGSLAGSENMIWGLSPAFKELGVSFSDSIELEFDTKRRLKVQVNILQRRGENPPSDSERGELGESQSKGAKESQLVIVLRFLRQLHERAKNRTPLHAKVKLGNHNSFGVSTGKSGLRYGYIVVMDRGIVNLYIDNGDKEWNKDEFTRLYEHKTEIEEVFGEKLEWHLMPEQKSSYIRFTVSGYNLRSKDTWIEFQDKLIDAMIRMERAFRPFIKE